MKALAWTFIALNAFNVLSEPYFYGRPRQPYGKATFFPSIIGGALTTILCGRVLGWW